MPAPEPIPDLLKAVNEASGKAFALWVTFLTVGTYLAIAIGTTTHLQLLLASPVKRGYRSRWCRERDRHRAQGPGGGCDA